MFAHDVEEFVGMQNNFSAFTSCQTKGKSVKIFLVCAEGVGV